MSFRELELPAVTRVETDHGSNVEPPLNPAWNDERKLAWHAAVTAYDSGVSVRVFAGASQIQHGGEWVDVPDSYSLTIGGSSSHSSYSFQRAWAFLNGVDAGAGAVR